MINTFNIILLSMVPYVKNHNIPGDFGPIQPKII